MSAPVRLTATDLEAIRKVHPFSRTLGPGPYRFVGMFTINLEAGRQGRPYVNPSEVHPRFVTGCGTCAHCGMAILSVYQVMTADGDVYGVGCDCVGKLALPVVEMTRVQRAKVEHDRKVRADRKRRKGEEARGRLSDLIQSEGERMAKLPNPSLNPVSHPQLYAASSLLKYATWILERSSDGGVVFGLKRVERVLSDAILPAAGSDRG